MHRNILKKMESCILAYHLLQKGDRVTVGLSGGADSVALLLALREIGEYRLYAVHMNHLLRGESATRDENFCRALCERLGIPLSVYRRDVQKYALEHKVGIEVSGRELRREIMTDAAAKNESYIATAHHLDDCIESFYLNVMRGAGLDGLATIPPKNGRIVRPFLYVSRAEILEYLQKKNESFIVDESNFENTYKRNRLRNLVFPLMEEHELFFRKGTAAVIEKARADRDFWEKRIAEILGEETSISWDRLQSLHVSEQSRVVRELYRRGSGSTMDLGAAQIAQILKLQRSGQFVVVRGMKFVNRFGMLEIYREENGETEVQISETDRIREEGGHVVYIDANKVAGNLHVRYRREGDRYRPIGGGSRKLKDFMIECRIPRWERDSLPLVADEEKICWVAGQRISEDVKIEEYAESKAGAFRGRFYRLEWKKREE